PLVASGRRSGSSAPGPWRPAAGDDKTIRLTIEGAYGEKGPLSLPSDIRTSRRRLIYRQAGITSLGEKRVHCRHLMVLRDTNVRFPTPDDNSGWTNASSGACSAIGTELVTRMQHVVCA